MKYKRLSDDTNILVISMSDGVDLLCKPSNSFHADLMSGKKFIYVDMAVTGYKVINADKIISYYENTFGNILAAQAYNYYKNQDDKERILTSLEQLEKEE